MTKFSHQFIAAINQGCQKGANQVEKRAAVKDDVRPVLPQGSQENHGNGYETERKEIVQREGDAVKVQTCSEYSQDSSQISGPDGRSKPTPLGQIGFRDTASVGGGQQ
ncbi:unnamed protein product, partial [Prunus brigantina]